MSQPHIPDELPLKNLDWQRLIEPACQANAAISRYDEILRSMINPEILLSPITMREAVLSSRIEGTQASLSEVLQHEAGEEYGKEKTHDIYEILNYRTALVEAEHDLTHRPISLSLIKAIHKILMDGVRGKDKLPGAFRNDQNWIGSKGCTIEQARFVPPNPIILSEHIEKWERYAQDSTEDALIKLAVIHAQFEILHPFMDGNGRIGRLIIPLFLYKRGVLHRPMFYLSEFLEANRELYYDKLLLITKKNDWQGWIEFFLDAVLNQSNANTEKARRIDLLYKKMKQAFIEATHSQYAIAALDTLFEKPIISSSDFIKRSRIPTAATAGVILRKLHTQGFITLSKKASGRAPAVYIFPELLNIAEGKKIFQPTITILT